VHLRHPWCGILPLAVMVAAAARADEPPYAEWRSVETAAETLEYRNALRNNAFEDKSRDFIRDVIVPQLSLPSNRGTIDRVRRRIRDIVCDPSGEPRALDLAGQVLITAMKSLAADADADMVTRVNAMLLVGDINAKGGKPAAAAIGPLTEAAADTRLPAAVRIAAVAGLARHADAGPLPAPAVAELVKIVASPAMADPVAADWLASRALATLARQAAALPPEAVAAAAAVLADTGRSLDTRVRAAAVVGAAVRPDVGIDVGKAVAASREIASTSLTQEATRDVTLDLPAVAGGTGGPPPGRAAAASPVPAGPPPQVQGCRLVAWRLDTLAKALARPDGTGGIVAAAGPDAALVQGLANTLRTIAERIDSAPDVASIRDALDVLAAAGGPAAAGEGAAGDGAAATGAAPPSQPSGTGPPEPATDLPF
jgi:hypothetical protein